MIVAGLDPSLVGTALTILETGKTSRTYEWGSTDQGDRVDERNARYRQILSQLVPVIAECRPSVVVIEGHPFLASGKAFDRTEFRGQLMLELAPLVGQWVEPKPSQLKRFTAKNGAADKEDMKRAVAQAWGPVFKSDNQADSYACAQLGVYLCSFMGSGRPLQEHLAQLLNEEVPKPRRPRGVVIRRRAKP